MHSSSDNIIIITSRYKLFNKFDFVFFLFFFQNIGIFLSQIYMMRVVTGTMIELHENII